MSELTPLVPLDPANDCAAPRPPTLRRLFFGDDGLRAGWSLLLFAVLVVAIGAATRALNHRLHLLPTGVAARQMTPASTLSRDLVDFAVSALAALVMSLVERRPFARYGLPLRRMLSDLLAGVMWGFVLLSLLVGALFFMHALAFDGIALHGALALSFGLRWALAFFCVGLFEEFFTRGYLQYTVARGVAGITRALAPGTRHAHAIGFWIAAFLFSVCLFMAGHTSNPGETVWGIIAVGLAGIVFAFSLWRTGSLWWAIGIHTSWDWAQSCLYGTSDSGLAATGHILSTHPIGPAWLSGGTTGPEGSIFVIPTLLLVGAIIHITLPRRPYCLTANKSQPLAPLVHLD